MNKRLYAAAILSAAALWGCIGVFLRGMTDLGLSSMQAMSARTVFAAAVLLPVLWLRGRSLLRLERLSDLRYFFGTGILSLLFFNWCYFGAIKASSMSVAEVLLYTSPIFVVLLSAACFGERITRCKALALCCTFAGCALVSGLLSQGEGIGMRAFLLGIGSGSVSYTHLDVYKRQVPGIPGAWAELSRRFGRLPFEELLAPAVSYAEDGDVYKRQTYFEKPQNRLNSSHEI